MHHSLHRCAYVQYWILILTVGSRRRAVSPSTIYQESMLPEDQDPVTLQLHKHVTLSFIRQDTQMASSTSISKYSKCLCKNSYVLLPAFIYFIPYIILYLHTNIQLNHDLRYLFYEIMSN